MMDFSRRLALVVTSTLSAAAAHADGPVAAPATPTVAPVVVAGGAGPKLLSSFPADGATVPAGVIAVTLKFDRPIADKPNLRALGPQPGEPTPQCLAQARALDEGKTLVILCSTRPGKAYEIALGPGSGLMGAEEKLILPADVHFATNETIIDNIPDALETAGLPVDADPVMGWRELGGPDTVSPGAALSPKPAPKVGLQD